MRRDIPCPTVLCNYRDGVLVVFRYYSDNFFSTTTTAVYLFTNTEFHHLGVAEEVETLFYAPTVHAERSVGDTNVLGELQEIRSEIGGRFGWDSRWDFLVEPIHDRSNLLTMLHCST